jgi:hypothetical protein
MMPAKRVQANGSRRILSPETRVRIPVAVPNSLQIATFLSVCDLPYILDSGNGGDG